MTASPTSDSRHRLVERPWGALYAEEDGVGEPLLLLHGLAQGVWVWRYVLPLLAERRRAIAFDARGAGRSAKPPPPYTVGDMAGDAAAVLAAFGVARADVLGFSMGGYVALTLARSRPELVRSLVLVATGAGGRDRVPRPAHVREAFAAAFALPLPELGRETMPYTFAADWKERNRDRFEEILAACLEHPTPHESIAAHAHACYRFYDEGCPVEEIGVPALVVHGDADVIVPVENGRCLAARLPGSQYVELRGAGHNLALEQPERLVSLAEGFLRRVEAAQPAAERNASPST